MAHIAKCRDILSKLERLLPLRRMRLRNRLMTGITGLGNRMNVFALKKRRVALTGGTALFCRSLRLKDNQARCSKKSEKKQQ